MCLIVIAYKMDPRYPLIVAANRDEFHSRPSHKADWWADQGALLGGRDLQAGGTWLAVHRDGRFAAVTNFRDADATRPGKRSRGHLVTDFLLADAAPGDYLARIDGEQYAGFNLLMADSHSLAYASNRGGSAGVLAPGIYGVSNATLNTPWEKVERSKAALAGLVAAGNVNETSLLRLLADRNKGPVAEVKSNRLPFATAHAITAPFITLPEYGTRCSTIVLADADGRWLLLERRFTPEGRKSGESHYTFEVAAATS